MMEGSSRSRTCLHAEPGEPQRRGDSRHFCWDVDGWDGRCDTSARAFVELPAYSVAYSVLL